MSSTFETEMANRIRPVLDPDFVPAALWNRAYRRRVAGSSRRQPLRIALEREDGSISTFQTEILAHEGDWKGLNQVYVERLFKFLLWQRGGRRITLGGPPELGAFLAKMYSPTGARSFDSELIGEKVYGGAIRVETTSVDDTPEEKETSAHLGRHLDGCRIGFDLGGSDRKCAAVKDGEVLHTEEVKWNPYFQTDPKWHYDGINDSLKRAAAKLPRVDAVGGSSAGVYVNNEVRVASLFRGVAPDLFESKVRRMFFDLQREWGGKPFVVVNDGEVTALAGSMNLGDNAVLGVAMGTSLAAGYVKPDGTITTWLNELAFAPVDYRLDAPEDEWSGDRGVGAQYFSQQAVGRLLEVSGIELPSDTPLPEKLVEVQKLGEAGDPRAVKIYETIGVYFGYTVAHYADFYTLRNLLVLGRVLSGEGGEIILSRAEAVLTAEFPDLAGRIKLVTPGETEKRHGQAVAAASLPELQPASSGSSLGSRG